MRLKTKLATLTALLTLATVPQALAPTQAGAVATQTTSACTQVTTPTGGVVLQCPVITGGTVEAYRVPNDRDFAYPVGELPRCYKNPAACGPQAIGGRGSVTDRDLHIGGGPVAKGWRPQARSAKKSEEKDDPVTECRRLWTDGKLVLSDTSFNADFEYRRGWIDRDIVKFSEAFVSAYVRDVGPSKEVRALLHHLHNLREELADLEAGRQARKEYKEKGCGNILFP